MYVKLTDSRSRVTEFWRADLMEGHYERPINVQEDEDGVRYFRVNAEVGEKLLEEDAYAEYGGESEDQSTDAEDDDDAADSADESASDSESDSDSAGSDDDASESDGGADDDESDGDSDTE